MDELVTVNNPIQLPTRNATMIETYASRVFTEGYGRMQENIKFYNALIDTLARPVLFTPPVGRKMNVFELGPKHGIVVPAILAFFSGVELTKAGEAVNYTGIDISEKDIAEANRRKTQLFPLAQVQFVVGDARAADTIHPLQPADIVICRHPSIEITDAEGETVTNPVWEEMFPAWQKRLTDDGRLLVTTYWPNEFERVKTVLTGHILLEGTPMQEGAADTDKYICVAGKSETANKPIVLRNGIIAPQ